MVYSKDTIVVYSKGTIVVHSNDTIVVYSKDTIVVYNKDTIVVFTQEKCLKGFELKFIRHVFFSAKMEALKELQFRPAVSDDTCY